jgi:hypothetical protein
MEEEDSIELTEVEISTLQQILKAFLAHTADKDGNGFYIRKKNIWTYYIVRKIKYHYICNQIV